MRSILIISFIGLNFIGLANDITVDSLLLKAKNLYSIDKKGAYQLELKALDLAKEIEYYKGLIKANYYLGFYFDSEEDIPSATAYYLDAIRASSYVSDSTSLGWSLLASMNLGGIFRKNQVLDLAEVFTKSGIAISENIKNNSKKVSLLFTLQKIYRDQGRFDKALKVLDEIIEISPSLSKHYFRSLNGKGLVYLENKNYDEAISQFSTLAEIAENEDNKEYLGFSFHNLADISMKLRHPIDAVIFYRKSIDVKRTIISRNSNSLFISLKDIGSAYMAIDDLSMAEIELLNAENLIPQILNNPEYFYIYEQLHKLYFRMGDMDKALKYSLQFQSELSSFLENQSEIKDASQQYNMRLIVTNYYEEIEAQRKAQQSERIFIAIIVGLSLMLFLFVSYHFVSKYQLKRVLTQNLSRLEWAED